MKRNNSAAAAAQPSDAPSAARRIQSVVVLAYPYAQTAAGRLTPLTREAVRRISPYGKQAAVLLVPYAQQAATRIGPAAQTAKQRSAQAAQDAVRAVGPRLDDAYLRLNPVLLSARSRVSDELAPRLSGAWEVAAATPVVVEATKRGRAALAAARGELTLPEVAAKKQGGWPKRLVLVAGAAGVAGAGVVAVKKWLGVKEADEQAAETDSPEQTDATAEVTTSPVSEDVVSPVAPESTEPVTPQTGGGTDVGSPAPGAATPEDHPTNG